MSLANVSRPKRVEVALTEGTTSIGAIPVAAAVVAPVAGFVQRVYATPSGTTTGTITVAVAINGGSDICAGGLTIAAGSGSRNNPPFEFPANIGTGAGPSVSEGDIISFTPSGGGGSSIGGAFTLVIRAHN
jgi:hypothetical protein